MHPTLASRSTNLDSAPASGVVERHAEVDQADRSSGTATARQEAPEAPDQETGPCLRCSHVRGVNEQPAGTCPAWSVAPGQAVIRDGEYWMLQLEVDDDPADLARLRAYVHSIAALFELSNAVTGDLVFVASELVSNVVQHARTGSVVTIRRSGNLLRVSVADYSTKPPRMRTGAQRDLSGLALIEALSTRWGWTDHGKSGKTVWATLDLRRR